MTRKGCLYGISFFIVLTLGLSACGPKEPTLQGKYNYANDGNLYYNFVDGTNYTTNILWKYWNIQDSSTGTYTIDGSKVILYINGDEHIKHEIGYIYKNYIGFWCEGEFPSENNKTAEISLILSENAHSEYRFKEDGTYQYIALSDNEIVPIEEGTYSVSNNVLTCTNVKNEVRNFLNTKEGIFRISYTKE